MALTGCASGKPSPRVETEGRSDPAAQAAALLDASDESGHDAAAPSVKRATEDATLRTAAPGSTLRTIACGTSRCTPTKELCLFRDAAWRCVAAQPDHSAYPGVDAVYECDDESDCAAGSTCCALHMGGGYCQPRKGAGAPLQCNEELCVPDGGTPCPAGEACEKAAGPSGDSFCQTRPLRATCAPGKRCGADAGLCVWNMASKTGTCRGASDEEAVNAGRISVFQCTLPGDCGSGMRCCTSMAGASRGTFCQPACELADSTFLCENDAQCRQGAQEPFKKARCVPASKSTFKESGYPSWVSVCQFE
jgi:hypothetical protein